MTSDQITTAAARRAAFENCPLNKPSVLIRLAVEDLEAIALDPRYEIDFTTWHRPQPDGRCSVCFAGAVMARRLECHPEDSNGPLRWNEFTKCKLLALDAFRCGDIEVALDNCAVHRWYPGELSIPVTPYNKNPALFTLTMLSLAGWLENHGH
jgi:hypothetical protein